MWTKSKNYKKNLLILAGQQIFCNQKSIAGRTGATLSGTKTPGSYHFWEIYMGFRIFCTFPGENVVLK